MLLYGLVTSPPSGRRPEPSFEEDRSHRGPAALGMRLFLLTLSVLFTASLILYLIVRFSAAAWPPAGAPPLPRGLWLSTLLILSSSLTMHLALRAARVGRHERLRGWILASAALGLAFLVAQSLNWLDYVRAIPREIWSTPAVVTYPPEAPRPDARLYYFLFFMLTGVHAAHVLGGLVSLTIVASGAFRNRYTPANHVGVRSCATYWHFLDVVWLVMLGVIVLA